MRSVSFTGAWISHPLTPVIVGSCPYEKIMSFTVAKQSSSSKMHHIHHMDNTYRYSYNRFSYIFQRFINFVDLNAFVINCDFLLVINIPELTWLILVLNLLSNISIYYKHLVILFVILCKTFISRVLMSYMIFKTLVWNWSKTAKY